MLSFAAAFTGLLNAPFTELFDASLSELLDAPFTELFDALLTEPSGRALPRTF